MCDKLIEISYLKTTMNDETDILINDETTSLINNDGFECNWIIEMYCKLKNAILNRKSSINLLRGLSKKYEELQMVLCTTLCVVDVFNILNNSGISVWYGTSSEMKFINKKLIIVKDKLSSCVIVHEVTGEGSVRYISNKYWTYNYGFNKFIKIALPVFFIL